MVANTISNLPIVQRLSAGFGLVLALMVALLLLALATVNGVKDNLRTVVQQDKEKILQTSAMNKAILRQSLVIRNIALLRDVTDMQQEVAKLEPLRERYEAAEAKLMAMPLSEREKELLAIVQASDTAAAKPTREAINVGLTFFANEAAEILNNDVLPIQADWTRALDELVDYVQRAADERAREAERVSDFNSRLMVILGLAAVALGLSVALVISRSITKPLGDAVTAAKRVAAGDLSGAIAAGARDETGQLLDALRTMTASLGQIAVKVRASADAITAAGQELTAGSDELSQRTEEQASSLEETAASLEELTSTVKQNAGNAREANALAAGAARVAAKGGGIVENVTSTMGLIAQSSKKVADIIGLIEGIAFQTNILSLNAAVEAARAGEHGHGFAVVAAEVRSLADRAAGAAKEIKTLIDDSVAKVDQGTQLAQEAGTTMSEIVRSVQQVADIIAEIAAASDEQSSGIEQINQAVVQIDGATQQNAGLAQETAAASAALQTQVGVLQEAVSVFRFAAAAPAPLAEVVDIASHPAHAAGETRATAPDGDRPRPRAAFSRPSAVSTRSGVRPAGKAAGEWREL